MARPFLPDEQRNFRAAFVLLAVAFAAVTVWAFLDEGWTRRPWKQWQQAYLALKPGLAGDPTVQQWVVPALGVVDRCTTCHAGVDDPAMTGQAVPRVLRVHPQRDTLLKNHPPRRFGCTTCHRGQGLALTEATAHGPGDPHWPEPLLPGPFVQASCLGCHAESVELAGAATLTTGRQLFADLGCGGCHATGSGEVQRRGPSLKRVASKLQPEWMLAWIRDPVQRRAHYQMPQFWPGAQTDPLQRQRRDRESLAIAAYLVQQSEPWPLAAAVTPSDVADAEAGRALFDRVGCRGCHSLGPGRDDVNISEPKSDVAATADAAWASFETPPAQAQTPTDLPAFAAVAFAPPLAEAAARLQPGFVAAWLRDPSSYWAEARMPTPRVTAPEAAQLQAFLLGPGDAEAAHAAPVAALHAPIDPALAREGQRLIGLYGCFGCHEINGFASDTRPGPDLSDYGAKDPRDMLFAAEVPRAGRTWEYATRAKLARPQALADAKIKLTMPDFALNDAQVLALAVYLRGLRDRPVPPEYRLEPPDAAANRLAESVVAERGCRQCHALDQQPAVIAQFYDQPQLAPPSLDVAADRLQPAWLYGYLLRPGPVRPWLQVRMPDFRLSAAQAQAVTDWLLHKAGHPRGLRPLHAVAMTTERAKLAGQLFERLKCVTCHRLQRSDGVETAQLAPDLGLARQRLDPAWIFKFLADPNLVLPGTKMPQFFPDGQSPAPDILGGDAAAQRQLLTDHLMNLGLLPADGMGGTTP